MFFIYGDNILEPMGGNQELIDGPMDIIWLLSSLYYYVEH